jgi:two-component system cell cycle response regulator
MDTTMTTNTFQDDDILIVDDEIPNLLLLTKLLEKEGYQVRPAEKAQTAIDAALAKPPGLILLDVRMPEMDGFELCRRLKQDKRTQHVPIIFVSALQDIEARIQGFEAGGVDFISKPFQEQEVLARDKIQEVISSSSTFPYSSFSADTDSGVSPVNFSYQLG